MNFKKFFSLSVMMAATFLSAAVAAAPEGSLGYRVQLSSAVAGEKVGMKAYSPAIYYSVSGFAKPTASVVKGSFLIDYSGQITWTAGFDGPTNLMSGKCKGMQYTQDPRSGETTGITGPCATGTIDPVSGTMQFKMNGPGYEIQAKGNFRSWFGPTGTLVVTPKAGYNTLGVWDNTTPVGVLFQDSTGSFFGSAGLYQSISGFIDSQGRGVLNFGDGRYEALTTSTGSFGFANFEGSNYSIAGSRGNFFAVNQAGKIVATGSVVSVAVDDPAWANVMKTQGTPIPAGFNAILQVNGIFYAGFMDSTSGRFASKSSLVSIEFFPFVDQII